jgi:hypothetical protein
MIEKPRFARGRECENTYMKRLKPRNRQILIINKIDCEVYSCFHITSNTIWNTINSQKPFPQLKIYVDKYPILS